MRKIKLIAIFLFSIFATYANAENWQQISPFLWIDIDSIEITVKLNRYYYVSVKQKQEIKLQNRSDPNLPYMTRFLLARLRDLNAYQCCAKWTNKCDAYLKSYSTKTNTSDGMTDVMINKDICLLNKQDQMSSNGYTRDYMVYDSKKDTLNTMIKGTATVSNIYVAGKLVSTMSIKATGDDRKSRLNITQGMKECEIYSKTPEYQNSCNSFKATNDVFYKYYYPKINFMMRTKR